MKKHNSLVTCLLLSHISAFNVFAQSTPAEFAEMSLQELFDMDVIEQTNELNRDTRWSLSYQYKKVEFDGYMDDDSSLNINEVLWSGPNEARTDKNFPVVPTVIKQNVHLVSIGYQVTPTFGLYAQFPYIEQETDHISIIPGYDQFLISTEGSGDVTLSGRYQFVNTNIHQWWVSLGVSLPFGSIDEQGDTPRAPGDQQLPYTMQLGSGTFDIPVELSYQHLGRHDFSVNFSAMIRTGQNDRDYRLGNHYRLSGKYRFPVSNTLSFSLAGEFQHSEKINGQDSSLLVNAPFPYPASITNPNLYGGQKLLVRAGLAWKVSRQFQIGLEIGKPVYQNLNGPQPGETWRSAIQLSTVF